jgi:hypothetical protein
MWQSHGIDRNDAARIPRIVADNCSLTLIFSKYRNPMALPVG